MRIPQNSLLLWQNISVVIFETHNLSLYGMRDDNNKVISPVITSIPTTKQKADALRYNKITFESFSMSFLYLTQVFSVQAIQMYGGQCVLNMRVKESGVVINSVIGRYIIESVKYDGVKIDLGLMDFRKTLTVKYPTKTLQKYRTADSDLYFPYMDDKYVGAIVPKCFGIANGIPGICTNGMQIYESGLQDPKVLTYNYLFPSGWNELYKIEINTGEIEVNGRKESGWVEIYPGLGNPFYAGDTDGGYIKTNPLLKSNYINRAEGIVKVPYQQALEGGEYGNEPQEIRMYARYPNSTMLDILYTLLLVASDNMPDKQIKLGFEGVGLLPMGLFMGESKDIYEWIETVQSANVIGGQLFTKNSDFMYKQENPNRDVKLTILESHVLNHHEARIEYAKDFAFSAIDLTYRMAWDESENAEAHYVVPGVSNNPADSNYESVDLTARYVRDFTNPVNSTFDLTGIQRRVNILKELGAKKRNKIQIELPMNKTYLALNIYDVVKYRAYLLDEDMEWIIYEKTFNYQREIITLVMVQRVKSVMFNNGNES
jgi:hypothetical protein